MKTIDIILLIILALGGYRGYRKGFLMELVAILALVLGIIGGFKLIHLGMEYLDEYVSPNLLPYVSFLLIFVLIIILVNVTGKLLKEAVHMTILGSVDSLMGAVTGIFKWAFAISVIFWIFNSFDLMLPVSAREDAEIYPLVVSFAPWVADKISIILPFADQVFDSLGEYFK